MEFSVIKEASELRSINGSGEMINAFPTKIQQRLPNAWPPGARTVRADGRLKVDGDPAEAALITAAEKAGMITADTHSAHPPRAEAIVSVKKCQEAGIQVKMITGDHALTAPCNARQLGLHGGGDGELIALTGRDLEHVSEDDLPEVPERTAAFARVALGEHDVRHLPRADARLRAKRAQPHAAPAARSAPANPHLSALHAHQPGHASHRCQRLRGVPVGARGAGGKCDRGAHHRHQRHRDGGNFLPAELPLAAAFDVPCRHVEQPLDLRRHRRDADRPAPLHPRSGDEPPFPHRTARPCILDLHHQRGLCGLLHRGVRKMGAPQGGARLSIPTNQK